MKNCSISWQCAMFIVVCVWYIVAMSFAACVYLYVCARLCSVYVHIAVCTCSVLCLRDQCCVQCCMYVFSAVFSVVCTCSVLYVRVQCCMNVFSAAWTCSVLCVRAQLCVRTRVRARQTCINVESGKQRCAQPALEGGLCGWHFLPLMTLVIMHHRHSPLLQLKFIYTHEILYLYIWFIN